jgi:hypothetical protein
MAELVAQIVGFPQTVRFELHFAFSWTAGSLLP